jgi:hypothetical protein
LLIIDGQITEKEINFITLFCQNYSNQFAIFKNQSNGSVHLSRWQQDTTNENIAQIEVGSIFL